MRERFFSNKSNRERAYKKVPAAPGLEGTRRQRRRAGTPTPLESGSLPLLLRQCLGFKINRIIFGDRNALRSPIFYRVSPQRAVKRHISSKVSAAELWSNGRQAIYRVPLRGTYRPKFIAGTNNQYSRFLRVGVLAWCLRHPPGRIARCLRHLSLF